LTAPDAPTSLDVNDAGTVLTGRGEPGATVTVRDANGVVLGTGTVAGNGTFTVNLNPAQDNGGELKVVQQDAAGNVSDPATVTLEDDQSPAAPTNLAVSDNGLVLSGRGEPGTKVTVTDAAGDVIGEDTVDPDGTFSVELDPAQLDGGELDVVLTDAAGNASTPGTVLAPDPDAPPAPTDIDINGTGTILTGEGQAGATVRVTNAAGATIGTGTVLGDGSFSITLSPAQIDGSEVRVTQTNAGGTSQPALTLSPDLIDPTAPTNLAVNDTGTTLTGRGEPGTTVTVTNAAGDTVGTGTVMGNGTFTITLTPAQTDGGNLTVILEDGGDNTSPPATVATPDLIAPAAPTGVTVSGDGSQLSGQGEAGATITVRDANGVVIGTGTAGSTGAFTIDLSPAQDNGGLVRVVQQDAAGNPSPIVTVTSPDTTGPDAASDLNVNDTGTVLTGRGEPGATVTITNEAGDTIGTGTVAQNGTFSIGLTPPQTDGGDLQVILTDAGGNPSDPTITPSPDLIGPDAPTGITVGTGGTTLTGQGEPGATVTVTNEAGQVVGTGTVGPTGEISIPLNPAQTAGGDLTVVLEDESGNPSTPVTVTAPDTLEPDQPGNLTVNTAGTILTGTGEIGTTVTVTNAAGQPVGTGTVGPDGTFTIGLSPAQTDGGNLSVTLEDESGNVSDPGTVPTTDTTPPAAPGGLVVEEGGTTLTGTGEPGATVTVTNAAGQPVGTTTVEEDGSFSVTLNPAQIDGGNLQVVQTDEGGNPSAPGVIASVDETPPALPTNLSVNADGTQITGRGEPGSDVTVRNAAGQVVATGEVEANGTFTITLSPAQNDGTGLQVTLADGSNNETDPVPVTTPDIVAPGAPTGLEPSPDRSELFGEGEPGATVTVTDADGVVVGTGTVGDDGTFLIPLTPPQTDAGELNVTLTDAAGNTSPETTLSIDDIQPPAPPTELVVSDDGLTLTGVGEPGTEVTVTGPGSVFLGSATVGPDGTFTVPLNAEQINGEELEVVLEDAAGNISDPATVFAPDPDAPPAPTNLDVIDDGNTLTGEGLAGTNITVKNAAGETVGTGTVDVDGTFSITLSPAQNDGGNLQVTLSNVAGTSQPGTVATDDLTAPDAPTNLSVNATGTTISGKGEPGAQVTITDAQGNEITTGTVGANGNFSITLNPARNDGGSLNVVLTDAAGNDSDPGTATTPDLTPPDAPTNLVVTTNGLQLTGAGEAGTTVTVTADGVIVGTGTVGSGGTFTVTLNPPQVDGTELEVTLTDAAGNVSDPETTSTLDTTAPDAPTNLILDGNGIDLTGEGEPGAAITVRNTAGQIVGTGTVDPDGTFSVTLSPAQVDGGDLSVVLTDAADNTSLPGTVTSQDETGPEPPTSLVVNSSGTLIGGGGEPGSTVTVTNAAGQVVGTGTVASDGTFSIGLSPSQVNGGELDVVLTDSAGNESDVASVNSPDLVPPTAPAGLDVNDTGTALTGNGEPGATVRVTNADGILVGTAVVGGNGTFTVTLSPAQADGRDLTVIQTDAANNPSPAATTDTPDLLPPDAPEDLAVSPAGTELTGTGEPGATITVTGTGGAVIGTGTVAANGTFSVGLSPAQVNGQELDVVQRDAAGNTSSPASTTAPGVDFALTNATDTAILDQTITRQNEAAPSAASATVTALLALSIGNLATVNLGQGNNPVVNFNLSGNTNSVDLDLRIGGLINVGLLSNYSVIIERWNGTAWVRGDYGTDNVDNGILRLNLLGSPTGEITLTDLDSGQYRATLVPNPGVTLGVGTVREISVTATDQVENVQISVGERAEGNFIDAAATGNTDDLRIAEIEFNGVTHTLVNGTVTVEGAFGTLVFNADGSYIYTPHTTVTVDSTDQFTVVVVDPVTGNELSSDLTIDVDVQDTSTMMMASASDEMSSFALADDGGGSDVTDSPDDNARTTAENDTSSDNPDAPDPDISATDTTVTDDTTSDAALADGSDTTPEQQEPVELALNADDGLSLLVQGGEEVDLSALDNLTGDTSVDVGGGDGTGLDISANVDLSNAVDAVVDLVETPPLDPFEPLSQDDDLATPRLPVV
ncbi:hypothetical protein JNB91_24605, partial [Rhizobium wenxiniae]|uniref:Ig-like domain-containing protein n=1 Tax=Rhizobium wenxiniae TaxID=1737357 RepID=UPI001C6E2054